MTNATRDHTHPTPVRVSKLKEKKSLATVNLVTQLDWTEKHLGDEWLTGLVVSNGKFPERVQ